MTGFWSFIIPQAATNLVVNPSFETNTTSWSTTSGGSIARVSSQQRRGAYALEHTPAATVTSGVAVAAMTVVNGQPYTLSFDFKGAVGVSYIAQFPVGAMGSVTFTGDGTWHRYTLTVTTNSTNALFTIGKNNSASTAAWYLDGVQFEAGSTATTYCDGDQPGCSWLGTLHGSQSQRSAQSRSGGVEVALSDYGLAVAKGGTIGMPPVDTIVTQYSYSDGGRYERSLARPRPVSLTATLDALSQPQLHQRRKDLIDFLKPDLVSQPQSFPLRYSADGTGQDAVNLLVAYDAGLDGGAQEGFSLPVPLRLLAADPFWYSDYQGGAALTTSQSLGSNNAIIQRSAAGVWANMSTGITGGTASVVCMAYDRNNNYLYIGGNFTTAGGFACSNITRYDAAAGTFNALGSGLGAECTALAIGPDGSIYAGGQFTTAGGGAANYIARWNGSTWSALGSGLNAGCDALAIGPDGTLYAGGTFSTAGGGAASSIASWNGSTWSALSTGLVGSASDLAVAPDGSIYVTGSFTSAGGVSASNIAKWNGSAFSALGAGLSAQGLSIAVAPDGAVYVGGAFLTAGGITVNRVARWNGVAWSALAGGANNQVTILYAAPDGSIYAGGSFTSIGSNSPPARAAVWNGSTWVGVDCEVPSAPSPNIAALAVSSSGALFMGYRATGTATTAGSTTVTNTGTAATYPTIRFIATAAARIYSVINWTTGQEIYFDDLTIQAGEIITINLSPRIKSVTSSWRGNILNVVMPGSNLTTFWLLSGSNSIGVFAGSGVTAAAYWPIRHWSVDGGAA
jgi:hypothetical protein